MIIYGSRAAHLKTTLSNTTTCPSCHTKGSLVFSIFRRHAHVFWIPLFPMGKTGVSECQHCKGVLKPKEMPQDVKNEYNLLKSDAKGPIWQFSGLVLIAILAVWFNQISKEDTQKELTYLSSPASGDIYEYKTDDGNYTSFKVMEVSTDSVFVSYNMYEVTKATGMYKIEEDKNYPNEQFGIAKEQLQDLYDDGSITNIKR